MRRFTGYRPSPPAEYRAQGAANAPDEPQYEGVVFTDGTVCCRWLTEFRSHSVWSSWDDFYRIHGHPEYGTRIDWHDEAESPEPEVNHGPLPDGGFWAGFCSNPECNVLGCPGDCRENADDEETTNDA